DLLMPGWIGVKTDLDAKDIIEDVKDRFSTNPEYVKATKRWIPVDHWCTLETLPSTVKEEYGEILTDKDRCFIDLEAHNADIDKAGTIKAISEVIGAKLDDAPVDKILRIDVFPKAVAIARVKRHSIFQSA
ncbi:hypothetical protein KY329_05265, partial [Candidatus Woesearchaeota archaeon]|nr:hypothetical protein [Candidatus Woesearchaeota archaeon]